MAETEAPLKKIYLGTPMTIKDMNNIGDNENNRAVLKQFKTMRLDSVIYLSGSQDYPSEELSVVVEYEMFEDGVYRIVPAHNPAKTVGIGKGQNVEKAMQLADSGEGLHWYLKYFEDNEHFIFTQNKQEIVMDTISILMDGN